jgi:hypothetical protein
MATTLLNNKHGYTNLKLGGVMKHEISTSIWFIIILCIMIFLHRENLKIIKHIDELDCNIIHMQGQLNKLTPPDDIMRLPIIEGKN